MNSGIWPRAGCEISPVAGAADFPNDDRIERLRETIVDLLVAIEIENILGGPKNAYIRQLTALLDWIDKSNPTITEQAVG